MSTAVAEPSSHVSSQTTRQKSGQTNQTGPGDAFSGLVDSNLNASDSNDAAPQPDRPRPPKRETGSEPQASPRTGIRRKAQEQTETQRSPSNSGTAASACRASDDQTSETVEAAIESQTVVAKVATTTMAGSEADQIDAKASETDDTQTTSAPAASGASTTGIVAAAVTVQIELAADTTQVLTPSDAVTVTNPPATIAAAPAGTAATALARVAIDTADTQANAPATTETATQAPAGANPDETTTATPGTTPTPANAGATDAGTETATAPEPAVETAAPEVLLSAKAHAELTATTKGDPTTSVDKPAVEPIIATSDPEPGSAPKSDDTKAASDQPATPKAEARNNHRVEAAAGNQDQPNRPSDGESRGPQRSSHEQAASISLHTQTVASEQQQPTGFGMSHSTTLQGQATPVQPTQLTAIPTAANMPVPVGGLAVEIAANAQIGRSRFEIRLDPPELGRIDVRLDVDQKGQVTSHLVVEKSATLDLLRRDAPQLERALQDAGLKTSDNGLQFSLRGQQQQGGRNDDQGSGRNAQRLIVTDEETVVAETAGRSYGRMIGQRGGIDIRV